VIVRHWTLNFSWRYCSSVACCNSFGGETTVVVKGDGVGGRNTEFALQIATLIKTYNFVFASIGTDGIDGASPAAGAISDSLTLKRANAIGLNPREYLERNDSYTFFEQFRRNAIITGRHWHKCGGCCRTCDY